MSTIKDLLKGLQPGRIQTIGYLQILPLISDLSSEKFGSFTDIKYGTEAFGKVILDNRANQSRDVILPFGYGFLKKDGGQDHALVNVAIVEKGKRVVDTTAACIQSTQGYTVPVAQHDVTILPYSIRQEIMKNVDRKHHDYKKIWTAILRFNEKVGVSQRRAHIEDYRDMFSTILDANLAHFERVYKQRGAIILIDGEVIGIEIAPSYQYFQDEWVPLIRESYGSLALEYRKKYGEIAPEPQTRIRLNQRGIRTIDDLAAQLKAVQQQEQEYVQSIIRDIIALKVTETMLHAINDVRSFDVTTDRFIGQCVRDGGELVYCSLVSNASWFDHRRFHRASGFEI